MKVVIDTNILVSACMGSYLSNQIIAHCLKGNLKPVIGVALFAEYEDVVNRNAIFKGCRLNKTERNELLDALLSVCTWTQIYYIWRPNLKDEADNHLVELAVASGAAYIVTRNLKDFRQAELNFHSFRVGLPESLLDILAKKPTLDNNPTDANSTDTNTNTGDK